MRHLPIKIQRCSNLPFPLPLKKGHLLPLNKRESPLPKDDLCQVWSKLAQRFWRRSRKCKSLQTDGQRAIRKSSMKLSAQVGWFIYCFTSRSRIFHLCGDVTITGEGLQNLGLCSALQALQNWDPMNARIYEHY